MRSNLRDTDNRFLPADLIDKHTSSVRMSVSMSTGASFLDHARAGLVVLCLWFLLLLLLLLLLRRENTGAEAEVR